LDAAVLPGGRCLWRQLDAVVLPGGSDLWRQPRMSGIGLIGNPSSRVGHPRHQPTAIK
jgi:hypothetical protein